MNRSAVLVLVVLSVVLWAPTAARAQTAVFAGLSAGSAWEVDNATIRRSVLSGGLGVSLTPRLAIGPEIAWFHGPGVARRRFFTGNVWYDLLDRSPALMPYVVAGGGLQRQTDQVGTGPYTSSEGAITGGAGVRIQIGRWFVAPEARVGWELHLRLTLVVGIR
jgi:hypothetical protein